MTPFWLSLLKRGMPVVIDLASGLSESILSRRHSAEKPADRDAAAPADIQTQKLDALQAAILRVANEVDAITLQQARLARAMAQVRWISIAALIMSMLAFSLALWL
jgi:predicted DNA repair protein MutK